MTSLRPADTGAEAEAFASATATLAAGSRTFRLASLLLPPSARGWGAIVYRFCRRVDDAVDDAPDAAEASAALDCIRRELDGTAEADAPMRLFARFCLHDEQLRGAAEALMAGVEQDLAPARFESDADLLRYAYAVAGTVGLLMCGVIGVRDRAAYPHAIDLGIAMQLTNICRDVADDARLGRRYLPADRLRRAGIEVMPGELAIRADEAPAVAAVLNDLLDLAERYYASADAGMRFIPWRTRIAMVVASRLYRQIGVKLRRNGARFVDGRTVVGPFEKATTLVSALIHCFRPSVTGWGVPLRHDRLLHGPLRGLPGAAS